MKIEKIKPHNFCETPEEKCIMNYCDENGCMNRKREATEDSILIEAPKQNILIEVINLKLPISIQPTANNDGHIIIDAEGTEYFFYNQEGTTELEYDGFCSNVKKPKNNK
jgi:hypothetical protein